MMWAWGSFSWVVAVLCFFFQAEDGIRDYKVTGVQTCALPISLKPDGVFVVKTFHGEAFGEVLARLKREFRKVMVRKPSASRGESSETYVVARGLLAL